MTPDTAMPPRPPHMGLPEQRGADPDHDPAGRPPLRTAREVIVSRFMAAALVATADTVRAEVDPGIRQAGTERDAESLAGAFIAGRIARELAAVKAAARRESS